MDRLRFVLHNRSLNEVTRGTASSCIYILYSYACSYDKVN